MATSVTLLAWGVLDFAEGHRAAGCLEAARRSLRWAADYLAGCRLGPRAYVGLVGDPERDHGSWTRPEDGRELRPAWIWREGTPAGDLLGAAAAALAVCSLVFQGEDPAYSKGLLAMAEDLYAWARTCPPGERWQGGRGGAPAGGSLEPAPSSRGCSSPS